MPIITQRLGGLRKTIILVRDTKNPALLRGARLQCSFHEDCANLLTEVDCFEVGRKLQNQRLTDDMSLGC